MTTNSVEQFMKQGKTILESEMNKVFLNKQIPAGLKPSMEYSLFAGGKRLRPILLFASFTTFKSGWERTFKTAIALEMIHTYSLIHDDLPAMDDDDYRRGKLTNHKKYNEATAILAGDALLTYSFELISNDPLLTDKEKVFLICELTKASGPEGMVAGQILDMEGERRTLSLKELEHIHYLKTGQLIHFAITAGAYLANISQEQLHHLQDFAYYLGLIFQVQDDILDIEGDPALLGKPVGSDSENDKSTYPTLLGLEGAKKQKEIYIHKATEELKAANADNSNLFGLLHYFSIRNH